MDKPTWSPTSRDEYIDHLENEIIRLKRAMPTIVVLHAQTRRPLTVVRAEMSVDAKTCTVEVQ